MWTISLAAKAQANDDDTLHHDPDTLSTIVVTGDGRLPIHVDKKEEIGKKGLSDFIPDNIMDKMLHPFAVAQRKKERHQKKMMKALRNYDKVGGDPNDELRKMLKELGILDELEANRPK